MAACDNSDLLDLRSSLDTGRPCLVLHWLGGEALLFHLPSSVHDNRNRDRGGLHIRICWRHHGICRFGARLRVDWSYGIGICLGL